MSRRVLDSDLSEAAHFSIMECAESSTFYGKDPLELFIELGELAEAEGFANIYDYIDFHLSFQKESS